MGNYRWNTSCLLYTSGETEEQFDNSLRFCDEIAFSSMHIFKYSPREGTPAATYPDQVSNEEKDRRSKLMQEVAEKNMLRYMEPVSYTHLDVYKRQGLRSTEE